MALRQSKVINGREMITIPQSVKILGVSKPLVARLIHSGILTRYRNPFSGSLFVPADEVKTLMDRIKSGEVIIPHTESWGVPPKLRQRILERDHFRCRYCGIPVEGRKAQTDHVIPYLQGGKATEENLVAACFPCNRKKGDQTPEEAGMTLLPVPEG